MRKQTKKLKLAKETLTLLSDKEKGWAKGGSFWATLCGCDSAGTEFVDHDSACPKVC